MASADNLCKKLLNVKNTVVESHNFYDDTDGVTHLRIKARPNIWHQDECPFCGRRNLPRYDRQAKKNKVWRGLDFSGILVEIEAAAHRVTCPEYLTENQRIRLDMIQANDPQLYRAYCLKKSLRLLLKSTDVEQAEADLKHWLWWTSHSRIPAFKDLYKKIKLIIRKA